MNRIGEKLFNFKTKEMVYKKYIKRGKKTFGSYYYESYRDKKGNVKTRTFKKQLNLIKS